MKIKELVKEVERTNELMKVINKKELVIVIDIQDMYNEIRNMKDLKRLMKNYSVLNNELKEEFLNKEIKQNEIFTLTYTWYDGWQDTYKIRISVY